MHPTQALITGGAGGLAKVIQSSLEMAGVHVLAPGRDELDVTSPDSVKAYLSAAKEIDLLVCNAGLTIDKPLARMTESDWIQVMDVNLKGAFLCAREVSRGMMKRRSGHVVFIASFSAVHPPSGQANYAASKAGIIGFSKSLALEYAKKNINVNCISPGFIKTEMTENIKEELKKILIAKIPSGELGSGQDVANCAAFLASEMSNYITGETIHVNGGMYMS